MMTSEAIYDYYSTQQYEKRMDFLTSFYVQPQLQAVLYTVFTTIMM